MIAESECTLFAEGLLVKPHIMYIELKSGQNDNGPARIGRVTFSKSGKSVYYRGKRFQTCKGHAFCANFFDVETGEEYWISGCKKAGGDRHWAGSGPVHIDEDVREEYWTEIRRLPQNRNRKLA